MNNRNNLGILNLYNPNKNISTNEFRHYIQQLGTSFLLVGDFNAKSQLFDTDINQPDPTGHRCCSWGHNHKW